MMTVKSEMSVIEYFEMVEGIALEYFDENGVYQPHVGMMNAMRLFYNKCIADSKFDSLVPHDNVDAIVMEPLFADHEFITAFNTAIDGNGLMCLNFANAYRNAMEIVDVKKTSLSHAVDMVKKSVHEIVNMISPALSDSNISAISAIAQNIANGNISADSVVEAYMNRLQKEADKEIENETK